MDMLAAYSPPSLGSGTWATNYQYDLDDRVTAVTRPDGVSVTSAYDSAGRLSTVTYPQGSQTRTYNVNTGQLASVVSPGSESVTYTYDGFLRTGVTWGGPVAGALSLGFDNNFRVTSQTVNGTALAFGYDADGLLTAAGAITLTLDPQNGHLNASALGAMTDSYSYDPNGLFASYTANYSGNPLYVESVVRDVVGRIIQKTETVQGTTHVWGYTFDTPGRLTDVTKDGSFFSHYGYDVDDNRTTYTNASGTTNPTYDAQDRLLTSGSTTYTYTANGDLTSKTASAGTTSYTYDPRGNLLHVGPPSGSGIDYVIDGENRRVGKEVGGTLATEYLYQDALNVVAQLDGSGNVVARYVFGTKPNVPDYFTTSTGTFRILSDHLGSPRLVVNTSSGAIVEQIDYDEFGVVTERYESGPDAVRVRGWAVRQGHGAPAVRGARLRCERGEVDEQGPDSIRRGDESLRVRGERSDSIAGIRSASMVPTARTTTRAARRTVEAITATRQTVRRIGVSGSGTTLGPTAHGSACRIAMPQKIQTA